MADLHLRGVFAEPYIVSAPKKFLGRDIPEYFTAAFYVIDNDGYKVNQENFKRFKTICYKLTLRVTEAGTVDIVYLSIEGAKVYKGHTVLTTKPYDPGTTATVLPRHLQQFYDNRARFISVATQVILQTSVYKKTKSGHSWTIGDKVEISGEELEAINARLVAPTYRKLDGSFFAEFARLYRELVLSGDKTPIKTLQRLYYPDKTVKHVQAYATKCRKLGLLPKAEQGRNSEIRKPRKKKGR